MYSPAATAMLALRPAAAAGRRAIATSAVAQESSSSLNSLKNSFWDALSGKSPKPKTQKDKDRSSSSPSSASSTSSAPDQAAGARGRGYARRRPSLLSSPTDSSSPAGKPVTFSAPTTVASGATAKDSPKRRSPAARRGPVAQSATARSRYPEPFIFETYQPPALADINFADGNPWSRTVPGMRPVPKGELLTEEKAKVIREYIGGDYTTHVAVLPKEVEAMLDVGQKRVLQGAMRVLNANASYKVGDKMTVVATVVEGVTGGKVKRSEVLKQ